MKTVFQIFTVLLAIILISCTVTIIIAKDNAEIKNGIDGGLDAKTSLDLGKTKDTIK